MSEEHTSILKQAAKDQSWLVWKEPYADPALVKIVTGPTSSGRWGVGSSTSLTTYWYADPEELRLATAQDLLTYTVMSSSW